jgi:hypothetical protein
LKLVRDYIYPVCALLLALCVVGAAGTKAGGNPFLVQTLIVSDSLRVGSSSTSRPAVISGDLDVWGTTTLHGTFVGGTSPYKGAVNWDVDLTSLVSDTKDCTVSGADTTMTATVQAGSQAVDPNVLYTARVLSNNQVRITATRTCGSGVDPGAAKFRVAVIP